MKALDYDGLDHVVDKIMDVINSGGSADYIVEEGTSGIWTYRKWASGIAECWGRNTVTISGTGTAWTSSAYTYAISAISYPLTFTETPMENATPVASSANAFWLYKSAGSEYDNTTTKSSGYQAIKFNSFNNGATLTVAYNVKGFWK